MALSLANLPLPIRSTGKAAVSLSPLPCRAAVRCSAVTPSNAHAGFPPDFVFGAASSAYQVEGATKEGGRGTSIWDTFCEDYPEKIADRSNGDPGAGSYWLYKEDVKKLKELGADVYRFSISWARILPNGRGKPNGEGIQYYKNLIQELLDHEIEPFVTIFHWDVPQKLENEYGGFLSHRIVEDYKYFADVCFDQFGDKVKHWITMNEPITFSVLGYATGQFAPGHCTPDLVYGGQEYECPVGDSLKEPYMVAHNILLAHAEVVEHYRKNYKDKQRGKLGITLFTNWFVPFDNSPHNLEAQKRALEFNLGWFMDPLKFGDYPFSMRSLVRERLPVFSAEESEKLKDSYDFIGINYYTSRYARSKGFDENYMPKICQDDARVDVLVDKNGVPIGYAESKSWVNVYPSGLRELLLYIKKRYSNPDVYITENGVMELKETLPLLLSEANSASNMRLPPPTPLEIHDTYRTQYQSVHLHELVEALRSGVNLRGYFVWSLLDSFEWSRGYTSKYGLHYVNTSTYHKIKPDLKRVPKQSAQWYKWFLSIAKSPVPLPNDQQPEDDIEVYEDNGSAPVVPTRASTALISKIVE